MGEGGVPPQVRTGMASVLFVDVVGSTQIRVRLGEEAADALRRDVDDFLFRAVDDAGGTVVKGLGDGVLATFGSAAEAVAAGVGMQQAAERAARRDADRAVTLRVGVSVGDVSFEGGDVFGTPVVEAARLCAVAQPGQILVADLVRSMARGRGAHAFESVGELELKGLPEPVAACRVAWAPFADERASGRLPLPGLLVNQGAAAYVGRGTVFEALEAAWTAANPGCRAVLLAGEAGIGKTRTADEFARRLHAAGALVLYGRCDEELGVPYQPFVEALEFHTANDSQPVLGRLPGELTRLLPELALRVAGLPAPVTSDARTEEYRLFEAVAAWLLAASEAAGLLLVLDDLHWAAKPTLLLLLHLLQAAPAHPAARLLVVATYRDTDVNRADPLSSVLADLRRLPQVDRIAVDGLSGDEVAAMVEGAAGHQLDEAGRRLAAVVHAETEGNPFFVGEVLRHLVETGQVRLVAGRWQVIEPDHLAVPEGVRDVVGRRLGRLSEATNAILSTASVIGRDVDLDVLAVLVDGGEDAVLDALDEASRARLVEETGADRFRFTHAVVRSTLYDELMSSRRRRLHRRVADALEKLRPDDVVALAHHSVEAGPDGGDTTRAVRYVLAAADRALAGRALSEAEARYRQAVELLDEGAGAQPAIRVLALCGLGDAQREQSDPAFRETLLTATRAALAQDNAELAARAAIANCRGMTSVIGAVDRDRVDLLQATLALGEQPADAAALLHATLAAELVYDPGTPADLLLGLADRAVEQARDCGDNRVLTDVLVRTAHATAVPERWQSAPAHAVEMVALADAGGDPTLRAMSRVLALSTHCRVGDFATARRLADEAVGIATDGCAPFAVWATKAHRVQFTAYDGDIAAARAANDAARDVGVQAGEPDALNWWGAFVGNLANLDGSYPDFADLAGSFADQYPGLVVWRCSHAACLSAAGRHDEARAIVDGYGLRAPEAFARGAFTIQAWVNLTLYAAEAQDALLGAALERILRSYQDAWATVSVFVTLPVRAALGLALMAQQRWANAVAEFEEADRLVVERGIVAHRPLIRHLLARVLWASGDPSYRQRAAALAAEVAAAAEDMGFDRLAATVRATVTT